MITLYGSYARGDYVDYDQRIEYRVPTYFMSDYDLLIVTKSRFASPIISNIMEKVKGKYYKAKGNCATFTDIRRDGIQLYDNVNHQ